MPLFWDKMRPLSSVLFVCQQLTIGGKLLHFGGSADMQYPGSDYMDMLMYARLNVTTLDTSCVACCCSDKTFFFFAYISFLYCKYCSILTILTHFKHFFQGNYVLKYELRWLLSNFVKLTNICASSEESSSNYCSANRKAARGKIAKIASVLQNIIILPQTFLMLCELLEAAYKVHLTFATSPLLSYQPPPFPSLVS